MSAEMITVLPARTNSGVAESRISGTGSPISEPYRLRTLILEDLERFPDSFGKDIHRRVGSEIPSAAGFQSGTYACSRLR
jgi:hypothetical protein